MDPESSLVSHFFSLCMTICLIFEGIIFFG
jgi:hypothetical protein